MAAIKISTFLRELAALTKRACQSSKNYIVLYGKCEVRTSHKKTGQIRKAKRVGVNLKNKKNMKFLIFASYSAEGAKGVLNSGSGTARSQMTEKMISELGGKMESFYYVSNCDAYVTCELPDVAAAAAIALAIKASGMGSITTTVLITPEDVDRATKLTVGYRHPGS